MTHEPVFIKKTADSKSLAVLFIPPLSLSFVLTTIDHTIINRTDGMVQIILYNNPSSFQEMFQILNIFSANLLFLHFHFPDDNFSPHCIVTIVRKIQTVSAANIY